jgi:chromosome partitioning protein
MEQQVYSSNDIQNIFRINERFKSPLTLLNAEERGDIPLAKRKNKGKVPVRLWSSEQLPAIGVKFGFLKESEKQHVVSCFLSKGGVMKSSFLYNFARTLALNSVKSKTNTESKILIIGLDIQESISNYALPKEEVDSLENASSSERLGLYDFLFEKVPLSKIIRKTDLPNLYVIPENSKLNNLEKRLRFETRKEYVFKDRLLPYLKEFSVVCFDNSPNWNSLIENSLVAADTVVSPVGCELGAYQALDNHTASIKDFAKAAQTEWDNYFLIPTFLEKNKISQQIYGSYLSQYPENMLTTPIRRAITGQEALTSHRSIFEYSPKSLLADDYYDAINLLWSKILLSENLNGTKA